MGTTDTSGPGTCPFTVDRPVMRQRWERLTFLHWRYPAEAVQRLLPPWLRVEECDGTAWVGLVPFFMRVATGGGYRAPWVSDFCETNVRTYVRDLDGRPGIWFFSLDAARAGAVVVARASYRLPYFWSRMRLSERGGQVAYQCQRRWPGPGPVTSEVRIGVGAPIPAPELSGLEHFLTARWLLFSRFGRRRVLARAEHRPWPLHRAQPVTVADHLVTAAGLPQPRGAPLTHYSPGVTVRIGRPELSAPGRP